MTDQETRIAIAEACGWTFPNPDQGKEMDLRQRGGPNERDRVLTMWGTPPKSWGYAATNWPVPDYVRSLDAMHEAEKVFPGHRMTYYEHLLDVCCEFPGTHTYSATAAQRAQAFLRTIAARGDLTG